MINRSVYLKRTQKRSVGIIFVLLVHALYDMSSGFNTARKAAWFKLTQVECARDRKNSQMLLRLLRQKRLAGLNINIDMTHLLN